MEFFSYNSFKTDPFFKSYHFNCIYKHGIGTDLRYIVGGNEDVPYQNT